MPKRATHRHEYLDPDTPEYDVLDACLREFERFVMIDTEGEAAGPTKVKLRMRKLLKEDPSVFRAIFGSGFIGASDMLAEMLNKARIIAELEHQMTHHPTKNMPRA